MCFSMKQISHTGVPPSHKLCTRHTQACLQYTIYMHAEHRRASSTNIKMTDAFLYERNYTHWHSSITQITHNKQAFLPYKDYSHRQSSLHKFYKRHTLVFLNETNYTHRRSSLTQIIHIGIPRFLHDTCSCNTRFKLL